MKIAIIGAGFTGLTAAYELLKKGFDVTIFEKDENPGGLAIGVKLKEWDWTLEKHYHHWFTNDDAVLSLAKEINYPVVIKRPKSSFYIADKSYQLDSPLKFLTFPKLPISDRLRMILVLGLLKLNPYWKMLEGVSANKILPKLMGNKTYDMLWRSQLENKMGKFANDVSLVWFWSRIAKRTPSLAYPEKGFLPFAQAIVEKIKEKNGKIIFKTDVIEINKTETTSVTYIVDKKTYKETFDKIIVTIPTSMLLKIIPQLPEDYKNKLIPLKGLGATNMIIRLKQQFLKDNTYWLSICKKNSPIMVIVEHTNFMDKKNYNNGHIIYVGNYLSNESENFFKNKEELLKIYDPLLTKINPDYKKDIIDYELFKAPFAQPIIPLNYSKIIPKFETPLKNIYLANMQQVYPWDRGTNYAVEMGKKIAGKIMNQE